jgi:hypothetical protein
MKDSPTENQCVWTVERRANHYAFLRSGCGKRGGDVGELNTAGWRVCPYCGKPYAFAARKAANAPSPTPPVDDAEADEELEAWAREIADE